MGYKFPKQGSGARGISHEPAKKELSTAENYSIPRIIIV